MKKSELDEHSRQIRRDNCLIEAIQRDKIFRSLKTKEKKRIIDILKKQAVEEKHGTVESYIKDDLNEFINWDEIETKAREILNKKELDSDILPLLDEEDFINQYLDQGQDKEGEWYYGFNLKGRPAIVRSNGKVLRNTQERFGDRKLGENSIKKVIPAHQGYIGDIAPTLLKNTVKRFILSIENDEKINPAELYDRIRDKILYYMDFAGQDEIADVLTCWVMATYCYELFYWFPHILINAPAGSGKSKCGYILTQLGFRGFDLGTSGGVTPAQIFRTLEGNRGTILIDEFEMAKGRQSDESQRLVNQILNASATKDAYVIRTEQINKKWRAWKFNIYCPKIACNITGINPTSLTRFIAFKWLKTATIKGKRKPYREKDKQSFVPIREDNYIFILQKWREVKEIYDSLNIEDMTNRDEDNWLPLFSIAQLVDRYDKNIGVEEQLKKYIQEYKTLSIETEDTQEEFFRVLFDKVGIEDKWYFCKEIAQFPDIVDMLSWLKKPENWIGKRLTLFKIKSKKTNKGKMYCLNKEKIKQIIELYYGTELTSQTSQTSQTQQTQQTSQTSLKSDVSDVSDVTREVGYGKKKVTLNLIRELDKGDGVDFSTLLKMSNMSEELLHEEVKRLKNDGSIFENKPDRWKMLQ